MAGHAGLFGGRRQQQQAGAVRRERLDTAIIMAGLACRVMQVMGLIHHQQIPGGVQGRLEQPRPGGQQIQAANDQLFALKGIVRPGAETQQAFLVKQGEAQVKAPQHFHQPLMGQRLRHDDQDPLGEAREQLIMQDHPGLNGLAEADLIGQQHPGGKPPGHFARDIDLMRQQAGPRAEQPARRRLLQAVAVREGGATQAVGAVVVELAAEQALFGGVEFDKAVQLGLLQPPYAPGLVLADVAQAALIGLDFEHLQALLILGADGLAGFVLDAGQRGAVDRVEPLLAHRREADPELAALHRNDNAQPQAGLGLADPALADHIF